MIVRTMAGAAVMVLAAVAARAEAFDPATLARQGKATSERIRQEGAAWTMEIDLRTGVVFEVETTMQRGRTRWVISARAAAIGKQPQRLGEVVSTGGISYATVAGKKTKYRDYEVEFGGLPLYVLLDLSDTGVFLSEEQCGKLVKVEGGKGSFRTPMPEPSRQQARGLIEQMKKLEAAGGMTAELKTQLALLEDMLTNGIEQEFDLATGVMTKVVNAKMTLKANGFHILSKGDEKVLEVKDSEYADATSPASTNMDEVAMFGHISAWRPGQKAGDMDVVLMDLKSGKWRRVPLAAGGGGVGTFSADRSKVYMTGINVGSGTFRIVQVDLKEGKTTNLGGPLSQTGFNMFVDRSFEGGKISYQHMDPGTGSMLESQIVVVDLATGKEKAIGERGDYAQAHWAAGEVLVFPRREKADLSDPRSAKRVQKATICKMDMSGKVTELVAGSMSVVLGDGKTILFDDEHAWKTCDLEGKNVKTVGDGLKDYSFPAAAPSGKRVVMMYFGDKTKGPQPRVVDVESGKVEGVKTEGGFWGTPGWR